MKLRAIVVDVYRTVLEVGPPPEDREARWSALFRECLGAGPSQPLGDFETDCRRLIAAEHAAARARGILYPEIYWPDLVVAARPELARLPAPALADFLLRQQAVFHTVSLMPGAAAALRLAGERGLRIGLASNAQPYTLAELDAALAPAGLDRSLFTPELCFWSFAHGFSKPDPHVFRLLTARLRMFGIAPAEALMVGDRLDNDIEPAQTQGWPTWHLAAQPVIMPGGDWAQLARFISTHAS